MQARVIPSESMERTLLEPGHIAVRFHAYLGALAHPRKVRWERLFVTF